MLCVFLHNVPHRITENAESILFREKFCDWPEPGRIIKMKGHISSGEVLVSESEMYLQGFCPELSEWWFLKVEGRNQSLKNDEPLLQLECIWCTISNILLWCEWCSNSLGGG